MTGFNLPPGCSVRDLPGCTDADMAAEAQAEAMYTWIDQQSCLSALSEDHKDELAAALCHLCDEVRTQAFADANADNQAAADLAAEYTCIVNDDDLAQLREVEKRMKGLNLAGDLAHLYGLILDRMQTPAQRDAADLAKYRGEIDV